MLTGPDTELGSLDRLTQALGGRDGRRQVGTVQEHGEFLSAHAGHGIALAHGAAKRVGHSLQRQIACVVPEPIVH